MSSHYPPQLQLSLPAGATSFKRTFEEFGFDLDSSSPTVTAHGIGDSGTSSNAVRVANGSATSPNATGSRQGSSITGGSIASSQHPHDGNDRHKRARSDGSFEFDTISASSSYSSLPSTSAATRTSSPGSEVDGAGSSRGATGFRNSTSHGGQHSQLHSSHSISGRFSNSTGRLRPPRYTHGVGLGHSSSISSGTRWSASSSSSSRSGLRHSVALSGLSSSSPFSSTLPVQPQSHSPTPSGPHANPHAHHAHEPPRIPTPQLVTDDTEMQTDNEDDDYPRVSTPPFLMLGFGFTPETVDSTSHSGDNSSSSASESSSPQLQTPSPGTSLTGAFPFGPGISSRPNLSSTTAPSNSILGTSIAESAPTSHRPVISLRRQQQQPLQPLVHLSSRTPTPPPILPPLTLSQDPFPLALPRAEQNSAQHSQSTEAPTAISNQAVNTDERSPFVSSSEYQSSGSGSSPSVCVSASPASSPESFSGANPIGQDDYAPIRERLASALDVLRSRSPLFNSSWDELESEQEQNRNSGSVPGPSGQNNSEDNSYSSSIASAQPPRIDIPIPSDERLIPIHWNDDTEPASGAAEQSSPSLETAPMSGLSAPVGSGQLASSALPLPTTSLSLRDTFRPPSPHLDLSWLGSGERTEVDRTNATVGGTQTTGGSPSGNAADANSPAEDSPIARGPPTRRSPSPELSLWDRSDSDEDGDDGRALLRRILHGPRLGPRRSSAFPFLPLDHFHAGRPESAMYSPTPPVFDDFLSSLGFGTHPSASRLPPVSSSPSYTPIRSQSLSQSHSRVRLGLSSTFTPSTTALGASLPRFPGTSSTSMSNVSMPRVATSSNSLVMENAAEIERRYAHAEMMQRLTRHLRDMEDSFRSNASPFSSSPSTSPPSIPIPRHRPLSHLASRYGSTHAPIRPPTPPRRAPLLSRLTLPPSDFINSDAFFGAEAVLSDSEGLARYRQDSNQDEIMTTRGLGNHDISNPYSNTNTSASPTTVPGAGSALGEIAGLRTNLGISSRSIGNDSGTARAQPPQLPAAIIPSTGAISLNPTATSSATQTYPSTSSTTPTSSLNRFLGGDFSMPSTAILRSSNSPASGISGSSTSRSTQVMGSARLNDVLDQHHPMYPLHYLYTNHSDQQARLQREVREDPESEASNRWPSLSTLVADRIPLGFSAGSRDYELPDIPRYRGLALEQRAQQDQQLPRPSSLGIASGPSLRLSLGLSDGDEGAVEGESSSDSSASFGFIPPSRTATESRAIVPPAGTPMRPDILSGPPPTSPHNPHRFLEFPPLPSPSFGNLFEQQQSASERQQRYTGNQVNSDVAMEEAQNHGVAEQRADNAGQGLSSDSVSIMDVSPPDSPARAAFHLHESVFRPPSPASWFRVEFGSGSPSRPLGPVSGLAGSGAADGRSSRPTSLVDPPGLGGVSTGEAAFERRSPSPRRELPNQLRAVGFSSSLADHSSNATSLNNHVRNASVPESPSSISSSSTYANLDPSAFGPGPFRNTLQRVVQDRRARERGIFLRHSLRGEEDGTSMQRAIPLPSGYEDIMPMNMTTTSTLGRRSRDGESSSQEVPTAHSLYPSSIQTSYRPALSSDLSRSHSIPRARPGPPTEIYSHLRQPDHATSLQRTGEEERRDMSLYLRRLTRMEPLRLDNPELNDISDSSSGLGSRSDITTPIGPTQSGFGSPPSPSISSAVTPHGSRSVNAPPPHSAGSSGGLRHAIEALSHDTPIPTAARSRHVITRDRSNAQPPLPLPGFRRVATTTTLTTNTPSSTSASSSAVDHHHHHYHHHHRHHHWGSLEPDLHHTPSLSWTSRGPRSSYAEDMEPAPPIPPTLGPTSTSLRERLFSRRSSSFSRGDNSHAFNGSSSGAGNSREEGSSDRPSPTRSRFRGTRWATRQFEHRSSLPTPDYLGGFRFFRGGASNSSLRSVGDYMRDEDFDESYESLLTLASMLGEVKPKHTPEHVIAGLDKAHYKDWKAHDADTRCPICLDDYLPQDPVMRLNDCSHWLHKDCLATWLRSAVTCPVCRKNVKTSEKASSPSPDPGPSSSRRRREDDSPENSRGGLGLSSNLPWLRDRRR